MKKHSDPESRPFRLGIYGGTFNPPHLGHERAAKVFLDEMELDKLLVMPTAIPPHKQVSEDDDPSVRLDLCRAAFGDGDSRVEVSDFEINKGGVSYTYETLSHFAEEGTELFFLCGTDMFVSLDKWREPQIIFDLATVVCVSRDDDQALLDLMSAKAEEYKVRYGAKVHLSSAAAVEVASCDVRALIAESCDISDLVSGKVLKIINDRGLYK